MGSPLTARDAADVRNLGFAFLIIALALWLISIAARAYSLYGAKQLIESDHHIVRKAKNLYKTSFRKLVEEYHALMQVSTLLSASTIPVELVEYECNVVPSGAMLRIILQFNDECNPAMWNVRLLHDIDVTQIAVYAGCENCSELDEQNHPDLQTSSLVEMPSSTAFTEGREAESSHIRSFAVEMDADIVAKFSGSPSRNPSLPFIVAISSASSSRPSLFYAADLVHSLDPRISQAMETANLCQSESGWADALDTSAREERNEEEGQPYKFTGLSFKLQHVALGKRLFRMQEVYVDDGMDDPRPGGEAGATHIPADSDSAEPRLSMQFPDMACIICCTAPAAVITLPCRHMISCAACIRRLSICPVCRKRIEYTVSVFKDVDRAKSVHEESVPRRQL